MSEEAAVKEPKMADQLTARDRPAVQQLAEAFCNSAMSVAFDSDALPDVAAAILAADPSLEVAIDEYPLLLAVLDAARRVAPMFARDLEDYYDPYEKALAEAIAAYDAAKGSAS